VKNAAKKLGITIVKNVAYDPKATSYAALALQMKSSGAQAVFIGGLICENGGKLVKDIRAGAPKVNILAPDGFTPISADVQQSAGKAEGHDRLGGGSPPSEEDVPGSGSRSSRPRSRRRTRASSRIRTRCMPQRRPR
jgi:ABC-type branched-chain amino acid transport systems, periplasmic component